MAETTQQAEALPEKGPWSMGWKELAKASGNLVEEATTTVKEAVKTLKGPWEMDWKTLSSFNPKQTPKEAPIKPIGQESEDYFDQVYSKLLSAESRNKHSDDKGNLTVSGKGALGISQVMPKTGALPGYGVTPIQDSSEQEYRRFGRDYLKAMVKEFDGDYEKAVAAYNAGASSVKKAIAKASNDKGDWKDYLPKRSETIPYLKKILGESFTKENALKVAEYLPVTGELLSAKEAVDEVSKGNYAAASLAAVGAIPGIGKASKVVKLGEATLAMLPSKFIKQAYDKGNAAILNNPIHLKDGSRLSGFTDQKHTTFYGYDKNGESFTVRADTLKAKDIVKSKDSNNTAEYVQNYLFERGQ